MDYRDRFAACLHCGAEYREPCSRCPSCGKDPQRSTGGAIAGWAQALLPLCVLIALMLLHRG